MAFVKKFNSNNWRIITIFVFAFLMFLISPEVGFANDTGAVQTKLVNAGTAIKTVLTALVVLVGIIAALKIVIKHLPSLDDPHVKNEMWKSIGGVMAAVAAGAALIWILPWIYSLFT